MKNYITNQFGLKQYKAHSICAMPVVYTWFSNENTEDRPGGTQT
jgi:hypothetical protein